jgi:hypothetical protein
MSSSSQQAVLKKIADIAKLAGIRGDVDDKGRFAAGFTFSDKRTQLVYVLPTMQLPAGTVVNIYSPCRLVKGGLLSGMSKEQALDLLKTNEKIPFARYSVLESDDGELLVMAGMDALLETLDAAEFHTYLWAVATHADAYEAMHEGKQAKDRY